MTRSNGPVPELLAVRDAIERCRQSRPDSWESLKSESSWEVYTDGSAPIKNPGGAIGFSAVFLANGRAWEVYGGTEGRIEEPATSNNRAEIAGVITILEVLYGLSTEGENLPVEVDVVCDSQYVVNCAQGRWKKHKNKDLWWRFDQLMCVTRQKKIRVNYRWTRAHVGTEWNERADQLAKDGAFLALGKLAPETEEAQTQEPPANPAPSTPTPSSQSCQYILSLHSEMAAGGSAEALYRLATPSRNRIQKLTFETVKTLDEAEYQTLIQGFQDLLSTLESAGRDPSDFTVAVESCRDLMLKQIQGQYGVKSERLLPLHKKAVGLARRFGRVQWTKTSKEDARSLSP